MPIFIIDFNKAILAFNKIIIIIIIKNAIFV